MSHRKEHMVALLINCMNIDESSMYSVDGNVIYRVIMEDQAEISQQIKKLN
jgi:hypothetical protein